MTGERWKRVNEIFHGALEVADSDREGFVLRAAGGDHGLEAEVRELLVADGAAEGYFEAPVVAEMRAVAPFEPGHVICDRFRIVRAVGEGGMGFVFEAYDTELAVTVAMKVIHPAIAGQAGALARFQQEVRLARQITHPNVCRTFDIDREVKVVDGVKRETVFLTMEFLEGETLAARLKRGGRMELKEACAVASQVASALDAAHELGIVHRDIKPANIVLVGARAVVMDFGLARLDSRVEGGSLSGGNQLVGTLAYMAPEQMEGGPVSAATDVYAFGLVLFEMVSGERAFPSESLLSGIWQRMAGAPPSAKGRVAGLPAEWERAIQGCLRRVPEERFQSAAEVVAVLGGGRAALPRGKWWAGVRGWWVWGAAIFLVGVALFAGGLRLRRTGAEAAVAPGALVYFAGIRNETGDGSLQSVGELMRSQLEQSTQFSLVSRDAVVSTLAAMGRDPGAVVDARAAREVALRSGAVLVIAGTVSRGSEGQEVLRMAIEQPEADGPEKARHRWDSEERQFPVIAGGTILPEVSEAVRGLGEWVRRRAGESAKGIVQLDRAPEDVTTDNWEALNRYVRAQELAARGDRDGAIAALKEAVRLDPEFALAYGRLGDMLTARMEMKEGYEAYDRALSAGMARRLSRRERDRIKGMYAYDTGDYETADAAFRDWEEFYENDPLAFEYQVGVLRNLGRPEDAIKALRRVLELRPHLKFALEETVISYLLAERLDEAASAEERLRQEGHAGEAALLEGQRQFLLKNYAAAEAEFRTLSANGEEAERAPGLALLARAEAERGGYREALTTLNEAVRKAEASGGAALLAGALLDRAWVRGKLDDTPGLIADVNRALGTNPRPQDVIAASRTLGETLSTKTGAQRAELAGQLEKLGDTLPARTVRQIDEMASWRVRGEVLLAHGDLTEGIGALRKAATLDATAGYRDYLARGLRLAAAQEPDAAKAKAMREEAMADYGLVALHPGAVWAFPMKTPPGFYAEQARGYAALAAPENSLLSGAESIGRKPGHRRTPVA